MTIHRLLLALIGVFFLFSPFNILAQGSQDNNLSVNISVSSSPIKTVTTSIMEQTGFNVQLFDIDGNFPVSGSFKNIKVEELYKRLFKGYNIAFTIDNTSKTIRVHSLGGIISQKPQQTTKTQKSTLQPKKNIAEPEPEIDWDSDTTEIDPLTNQSYKEIRDLHEQQTKDIERENSDMSRIDPLTNMTIGETKELHRKQNQKIKQNTTKEILK